MSLILTSIDNYVKSFSSLVYCNVIRGRLGRSGTWVRSVVNNFLTVPLACLGSGEAAVQ